MSKEQVPLSAFVSVLAFFLKLPRKASLLLWNKGHVAKVQETDASEKLQKKWKMVKQWWTMVKNCEAMVKNGESMVNNGEQS